MTRQSDSDEKIEEFVKIKVGITEITFKVRNNKSKRNLSLKTRNMVVATFLVSMFVVFNSPVVFLTSVIFIEVQPFNWFICKVFFSKEIQANIVDQWYRWARKGYLYAFFRMSMYLPQIVFASLSIMLEGFKNKRL